MKTLNDIDTKIVHWLETLTPDEERQLPTMRQLLINGVAVSKGKDGEESVDLYQVALKLKVKNGNGHVDLEDADFRLLKKKIEENAIGWPSHYHGQALAYLKAFEK